MDMQSGSSRLAHGWKLLRTASPSEALLREFIRPAVRAQAGFLPDRTFR